MNSTTAMPTYQIGETDVQSATKQTPMGLYIHIPWCVRKCPYCDFNSHQLRGEIDHGAYVNALLADLADELQAHPSLASRSIDSVFFGGGTPSLLSASAIGDILTGVAGMLTIERDAEITLEANPGASEQAKFSGFYAAGVNRLSMGIQSLDDQQLTALGRIHSSHEARAAVSMAQRAGFTNFNVDMMFALPTQSLVAAKQDLSELIELGASHISYYQLTLEPNTLFHAKPPTLPDEDLAADMQQQGIDLLAAHGYEQYEVSAYAKSGRRSQHNLHYWHFDDYLGIGAGAHGKLTTPEGEIIRRWKHKQPAFYQKSLQEQGSALGDQESIAAERQVFEFLLNRLRLKTPVEWQTFDDKIPHWNPETKQRYMPVFSQLEQDGLLEMTDEGFALSEQGHAFLNQVLLRFLPTDG